MSDKDAAITAHNDRFPIHLMCAALEVGASGYYASVQRAQAPPTVRAVATARRRLVVRAMFARCQRRYGAPRLVRELRDAGLRITQKTVAKILRADRLAARRPTPFVCTTDSAHAEPIADNVLARRVVGWAASASLATALPLTALQRALAWRQPAAGLLHHTDRDCRQSRLPRGTDGALRRAEHRSPRRLLGS